MFAKELTNAGSTTRFTMQPNGCGGWEIRVVQDGIVLRSESYTDWHRVERALDSVSREVWSLENKGWRARTPSR